MTLVGEKLLKQVRGLSGINQVDFFDTNILTFENEIRCICESNGCGRYNRAWNCPPVCGTIEELEAVCRHYAKGILLNIVRSLTDSFDLEGMMAGGRDLCRLLVLIDNIAQDLRMKDYRIFGSGGCYGCENCSYPDKPCQHPYKLFTPIEACGINVMQTSVQAGFKYINGQNTVTFFGMILFNDR